MAIKYKDFSVRKDGSELKHGSMGYREEHDVALASVNSWADKNDVDVINIETLNLIESAYINYCKYKIAIRVWYKEQPCQS